MTALSPMPPIASVDDLVQYPHAILADVRWYLDGRDARATYEAGHLPGAVFVDLGTHLAAHDAPATEGRHPFPSPEAFAASMGSLGIGDDDVVIAYDGALMTGAGTTREPQVFTPCAWPSDRFATADETATLAQSDDGLVLDAREYARYTGEVTVIDPRPGHIPGAVSAPFGAAIDASTRRFLIAQELRDHFTRLGVDPSHTQSVVAYCGSGVSACVNILAMEQVGLPPARLYVASFSGWSSDPTRDVEMGDGR